MSRVVIVLISFFSLFFFTLSFIFFFVTRSSVQRAATSSLPVLGLKLYPSLTSAILPFLPCYLNFVFSGFNRLLRVGVGGASLFRPFCGCSCRRLSFSLNLNLNFLPSLPPCSSLLSTTPHHTHSLSSIHPFLLCDIFFFFFFFFFSLSIYVDPHSFPLNLPLLSCSTLLHCSFHWLRSPTRHHPRFSLQWFRDFYRGIHRVELCEKGTALFFPPPSSCLADSLFLRPVLFLFAGSSSTFPFCARTTVPNSLFLPFSGCLPPNHRFLTRWNPLCVCVSVFKKPLVRLRLGPALEWPN